MDRAKNGDRDAFGKLYGTYSGMIYRYILVRVGTRPLAEDLTSETFLRAFRQLQLFTWQDKDFRAWLVTIARNLITDHFKSGRHRHEVSTDEIIEVPLDEALIPENAVVGTLVETTVRDAVRRLGREQRQCLVLRYMHELSLAETAMAMGKTTGAVKAMQRRAVKALARLLPEDILL